MHPNRQQLIDFLLNLQHSGIELRTSIQSNPECPNLSNEELNLLACLNTDVLLVCNHCIRMTQTT